MIDPADSKQLESLLRRHRIDLKHRLGQNFLVDPSVRDAVARSADIRPEDAVLEVGAGVGTLTVALAPLCRKLVAVEIDGRLVPALREATAGFGNVEIVRSDILRFNFRSAFPQGGELVAGNIPYNVTGALVRKLLDEEPRPQRLSLVVQKEVAERWTASTGASLSTVAVQVFAKARLVLTIPASAFNPPPRVDSALVSLEVRTRPAVDVDDLDGFFRFVESIFQFRRKQLGGALGRLAGAGGPAVVARLQAIGIDPTRRAQTLSLMEWEALYRGFSPRAGG
ncbi:MAG TPA: 16S rRNA (adenine(1518)-N(6)/adenine(1519)-N(6))-dimethyltransferase RsmA [Candidatus Dormibacteraeota bacterium]|nr:16S rRNA (adenine(1518)-N(6)/adenine(1519)-N(6))-dimethyltransferase RsmA [Candidatus Dormibacteraeota bacterium]